MYHVYSNRTQTNKKLQFKLSHDLLVKVVTSYIKIHYKKSHNANFLEILRFFSINTVCVKKTSY